MNKSIIDHRIVSSRYFFPRPEQFENPFRVDCGEAQLACYYRQINPDAKTIVFFSRQRRGGGRLYRIFCAPIRSLRLQ